MPTIAGIDPGLDGGIAVLRDDLPPVVHVMPTLPTGQGSKRTLNIPRIMQLLLDYGPDLVLVEKQQAYPKQGGVSNFTTGYGFGALCGLLTGLEMVCQIVRPAEWAKALGVTGKAKGGNAALVAGRLFPGVSLLATSRCYKPHSGVVDALLIAEWGRRQLTNERTIP